MKFFSKKPREPQSKRDCLDADEIVRKVSLVYADYNDEDKKVKSRSSLPCSWFAARECFVIAYEREYLELSEQLKDSYHHVYRELAYFVDDELFESFENSLEIALRCSYDLLRSRGISDQDEAFQESMILGPDTGDRNDIWTFLGEVAPTCPPYDRQHLAETLGYCNGMFKIMWDEWASFANLVEYRNKK